MRKFVIAIALLAHAGPPLAFSEGYDYEAPCRIWAQEDEVPADQVEDYVAACVEEQKANAMEVTAEQIPEPIDD